MDRGNGRNRVPNSRPVSSCGSQTAGKMVMGRVACFDTQANMKKTVDMWAITSYFNPIPYRRRSFNYHVFRRNLDLPLVTVELGFDGRYELTNKDADVLIQIDGGAVLWQKERLLNLALRA